MLIRPLNRSDFPQVIELLNLFSDESNLNLGHVEHVENAHKILLHCKLSGVNFVAQDQDRPILAGMILSLKDHEIWKPSIVRLREVAWYVRPEFRQTTVGGRLFLEYCKAADQMIERGEISSYTITKLHNSQDFDYASRGFKLIETTYLKGER